MSSRPSRAAATTAASTSYVRDLTPCYAQPKAAVLRSSRVSGRRSRRGAGVCGAAVELEPREIIGSALSCPICSPEQEAEDADVLYYPPDEEIPVSLCKHVYGYARDLEKHFELLDVLGKGSFGVVHRAVQRETGDFFAVKTLPKSRPTWTSGMDGGMREATTSTYLLKIQAEVNFLARLADIEDVVRLIKAYEDDSNVHLVMDLW